MNLPLKFLKLNNEPFVPVTTAEAVMVKRSTGVRRLDDVLKFKIELISTPVGSGLTSYPIDGGVILAHSNTIEPNNKFQPLIIKYDNRGHIVEAKEAEKLSITILNLDYAEYNGETAANLKYGDDFLNENGYILIRWNNL